MVKLPVCLFSSYNLRSKLFLNASVFVAPSLSVWWDDVYEASDLNKHTCETLKRPSAVKRKLSFSPPRGEFIFF